MTIYESGERLAEAHAALAEVDGARTAIERHTLSFADGKCRTCGVAAPCAEYKRASRVFRLTLVLPRRAPGASHPELFGARRVGSVGLLRAS